MKKIIFILFILTLAAPFSVFAVEEPFGDDPLDVVGKKPFIIHERRFEVGLANMNVFFANNFLTFKQVFNETVQINLDELKDGFNMNVGLNMSPFYFTYTSKKGWGFGLHTGVQGIGILSLSGNMLSLSEAVKETSDLSGALFASATISSKFNIKKFKVKFNPSLFYSLAYIKPEGLTYTMTHNDSTTLRIDYDLQVFAAVPIENFGSGFSLTGKPGFDITAGVSFPLAKEIGITKILPFLDFDISLDFINIPIAPSKMFDYMQLKDSVGGEIDFDHLDDFINIDSNAVYGKEEVGVRRPFKMLLSLDWRPLFGSRLLTVTPVVGFGISKLYGKVGSFEAGINGRLNIANCFIATLGVNYTDRMFVNSLNLAINFRAFELDLGAELRSQKFTKSWSGGGLGVNFGIKFGW
ncbi:MAG: hypothetical protein FWB95_03855 [Treponema sp.]|nr:hypothetical protein [Treponema sp.]